MSSIVPSRSWWVIVAASTLVASCARDGGDGNISPPDRRFSTPPEPDAPPPPDFDDDGGPPFGAPKEDAGYETCSPDSWCEIAWDEPLPALRKVWGFASNDVWIAGANGTALHYDGSKLSLVPTGTSNILTSMWGSAPNDLWAVGTSGTILHWNGSTWTRSAQAIASSFNAVWGRDAHEIWAVGVPATIVRGDGTLDGWSTIEIGDKSPYPFASVFGNSEEMWITHGELYSYPGIAVFAPDAPQPLELRRWTAFPDVYPEAVWASRPGDAWAVGWSADPVRTAQTGVPVFVGKVVHYGLDPGGSPYGSTPTVLESFTGGSRSPLRAIWALPSEGAGAEEMWAVGDLANVVHRKNGTWELMRTARNGRVTNCSLRSVWASSARDVWAVGSCEAERGVILRRSVP